MDTNQADTPSESGTKRIEDAHGWVQPFCQPVITNPSLIELASLFFKYSQDGGRSVTRLQLGGKWMCDEVLLCPLLVQLQGRN
jgi:hypothetical protein